MKVLVCGGRDFSKFDAFNWLERYLLDELAHATGCFSALSIDAIIHGGARGADEGAAEWAKSEDIPSRAYAADWKKHGKAAGPIRNQKMIDEAKPDFVVAFPGGRGTADMLRRARDHGIQIIRTEQL